jgi:hypothetical protein
MTFSNKFSALDNREAAILDSMSEEQRVVFEQICTDYDADFRPETTLERDTVYCLATLRWGLNRIRAIEENIRETFRQHGYLPLRFRPGLEEMRAYEKELHLRYEYFFSHAVGLQRTREAA